MPGFAAIGMAVGLSGIGATIGGIAISAAIGAAIGGLSAAVMGGDIGKGMLFGAVGGVVTGGIAGGAIVQGLGVSAMDAGTASIGMMGSAGEAVGGFGHGLATTGLSTTASAANTAGGLVFGGSMKGNLLTEAVKAGTGPLIKGVGAALLAEDDPGIDIENRVNLVGSDARRDLPRPSDNCWRSHSTLESSAETATPRSGRTAHLSGCIPVLRKRSRTVVAGKNNYGVVGDTGGIECV